MKLDPVAAIILGGFMGGAVTFIGRALWDHYISGRVEKGVYMKISDCEKHRDKCCVGQIKKDVATQGAWQMSAEKRLDKGSHDFEILRNDIRQMDRKLSGMQSIMEMMADHIKKK